MRQHNINKKQMTVLDLFSGIGGFSLGLERAGMRTVAFCEVDKFCRQVLRKHWPNVPIFKDVKELRGDQINEAVDVVCGGYPCQPFSSAGIRRGAGDDRFLWPEMFRIIREIGPRWVIGENVVGHIDLGLDTVLSDLAAAGYETRTFIIPACAVGAPHRRERVWIVANLADSNSISSKRQQSKVFDKEKREKQGNGRTESYSHVSGWRPAKPGVGGTLNGISAWVDGFDDGVQRTADGIPNRANRIKGLGNAVVPQIVEIIGRAIIECEDH